MHSSELLGTRAVSEWTGTPEETLRFWRATGTGPLSWKIGRRVVYSRDDVQRWLDDQRAQSLRGA